MSEKLEDGVKTNLKFETVPESDRQLIRSAVARIIEQNRDNEDNIQLLTLDALNCIGKADALLNDYNAKNVNFFVRAFNGVSGKNNKAVSKMLENLKAGQYAALEMIRRVSEGNLLSLQKTTAVSRRVSILKSECDAEFEHIYDVIANMLSDYSARLRRLESHMKKNDADISSLKDNIKKLKRSVMMNCQSCNEEIKSGEFVCPKCGKTVTAALPDFSDKSNLRDMESYAAKLSEAIMRQNDLTAFAWDNAVKKYADTMLRVQNVIDGGYINGVTSQTRNEIGRFIKKCGNREFQIALIGAVKAGKSTLMNAIAGCEAASTRVTPETASLTKFRSSADSGNHITVKFYSDSEWNNLWNKVTQIENSNKKATAFLKEYKQLNAEKEKNKWLNHKPIKMTIADFMDFKDEIEKWTSSRSAVHYFVAEAEIELSNRLTDFNMPPEVVFVDTPGLDDPVEYRSNITKDYMNSADAVVVCVKADALKSSELATITDVFKYTNDPHKVFICATQCDKLNRPLKEWDELKTQWLNQLSQDMCFGETALAEKNVIPVSAYFYNLIKKYDSIEITDDSDDEVNDEPDELDSIIRKYKVRASAYSDPNVREDLINKTNIELIKQRLQTDIIDKRKEILEKELANGFKACSGSLNDNVGKVISAQKEHISDLEKGIDELIGKKEENLEKIEQFRIEKEETVKDMRQLLSDTQANMKELISAISKLKINE